MNVHFSSKTDLWATPQAFFDELDKEFHFETDVCALPENAKGILRRNRTDCPKSGAGYAG